MNRPLWQASEQQQKEIINHIFKSGANGGGGGGGGEPTRLIGTLALTFLSISMRLVHSPTLTYQQVPDYELITAPRKEKKTPAQQAKCSCYCTLPCRTQSN